MKNARFSCLPNSQYLFHAFLRNDVEFFELLMGTIGAKRAVALHGHGWCEGSSGFSWARVVRIRMLVTDDHREVGRVIKRCTKTLSHKTIPPNNSQYVIIRLQSLHIRFVIKLCQSHAKPEARYPEQDTNNVDSQDQVQKTQSSSKDILMLLGTKRLYTWKHEESDVLTLNHKPHDEMSEMLQTQVLHNIT